MMQKILDQLRKYGEEYFVKSEGESYFAKPKLVVNSFSLLLGLSSLISLFYAVENIYSLCFSWYRVP